MDFNAYCIPKLNVETQLWIKNYLVNKSVSNVKARTYIRYLNMHPWLQ